MYYLHKTITIIFCFIILKCFSYQYDLSICTIFRDEAKFLKEWIEYHRMIGVQHFYLCSHNSIDNYKEVLDKYIKNGIVELKEINDMPNADLLQFCLKIQVGWYNECIIKAKQESKWISFIDADEFLYLSKGKSLVKFLKGYENFGGIGVNWFFFGTSNKTLKPKQLMIEELTSCFNPTNNSSFIKCIIQPKYSLKFTSPHHVEFIPEYFIVDTDKKNLDIYENGYGPTLYDKLRINHYWTRDEEYFWRVKIPRQNQLSRNSVEDVVKVRDSFNLNENVDIQRFVPELRKRMGLD